mmetsp:Transcript_9014/g.19682  ORF Transcript_9014/g.19682 Transcript_9014/m.19682 type:complete len:275 (-) Transcript_9014:109-933(-)
MRDERGDEVAVPCIHLFTDQAPLSVAVVEIDRANEEGCLHHEVPVVHGHVGIVRTAVADHAQLLYPLRPKRSASRHGSVTILVVGRLLEVPVQPCEHTRSQPRCLQTAAPHPVSCVVHVHPEIPKRHRVHLAHSPGDSQRVTHIQLAGAQLLKLLQFDVQLRRHDFQRPLEVVSLAEEASPHRSHLGSRFVFRQEDSDIIPDPHQVMRRVHFVPASAYHHGSHGSAAVHGHLEQITDAASSGRIHPPWHGCLRRIEKTRNGSIDGGSRPGSDFH